MQSLGLAEPPAVERDTSARRVRRPSTDCFVFETTGSPGDFGRAGHALISNLPKHGRCCNPRPYASITARITHEQT